MKPTLSKVLFLLLLVVSALPGVTPPMALLAGVVFAFSCVPVFPRFVKKTQKYLLQGCVVGLGFGMNVETALASGRQGMLMTIGSVVTVMCLGMFFARLLGVSRRTGYLVSAGTAICGGSAIAAVGPIVEAGEDEMSVSLGTIFILNAVALILFPPLGRLIGLSEIQFGEWAAIAIHDTSSVVGAGAAFGEKALEVAALVKCTRALWILPLAFVTMILWRKPGKRVAVPWFIFLFALAMVVNTYLPIPASFSKAIVMIARQGFSVTLFLIGTCLTRQALAACGVRPMIQGVMLWLVISVTSLLPILLLSK